MIWRDADVSNNTTRQKVIKKLRQIKYSDLPWGNEKRKSGKIVKLLRQENLQVTLLGKKNAMPLGINIFGWSPKFDDIYIEENQKILIEVKHINKRKLGYYFTDALTQYKLLEHSLRNTGVVDELLILILLKERRNTLNAVEEAIANAFQINIADIIIIGMS